MAKAATKPDKPAKKIKKTGAASVGKVKTKAKTKSAKKAKKANAATPERHSAFENLARLADHPLVADLLAAGAMAAVAVIADHQLGSKREASSKMVKTAGKAAAAAIGKKLIGEFGAIKDAATDAAKKA